VSRADATSEAVPCDGPGFDEFYDHALPIVFGYLLKMCGGDQDEAWDLTQDSWISVVDRLRQGQAGAATVGYLISTARSKYIDRWRRRERLQRKLRLVWAGDREPGDDTLAATDVLEHLADCSPTSRMVLMMAYVEEIPVSEIARQLEKPLSSTYSILARAREELRDRMNRELP
jgi:RNA polymerase sigma-70 factor (ECF subfamily)